TAPPLPRLAFPIIGAWLSWELLTPWFEGSLGTLGQKLPESAAQLLAAQMGWVAPALTVICGIAAGLAVGGPINRLLGLLFRGFHRGFGYTTGLYARAVGGLLRVSVVVLVVYGGLLVLTYGVFKSTPKGFIPSQDMGYLMISVQLPDSASKERADQVMAKIAKIGKELDGVRHVSGISGMSFMLGANGSNFGSLFVNLQDYKDRRNPQLHSKEIEAKLRARLGAEIDEAMVGVFPPPPVRGVGMAGGFALLLEDRGGFGPQFLQQQTESLIRKANQPIPDETPWLFGPDGKPKVTGLFSVYRANVPQI